MNESISSISQIFLSRGYRLLLLVAPRGSGKTSFLHKWSDDLARRNLLVAWIDLVPADNDPQRFVMDLVDGLGSLSQQIKEQLESEVHIDDAMHLEEEIVAIINVLLEQNENFALVLDNYQEIHAGPIHQAVELMLTYLPSQMHLAIASRNAPPLPISRLRVRRQLMEIHL